jgi:ubiquinone biosynthesis protein UbiJ
MAPKKAPKKQFISYNLKGETSEEKRDAKLSQLIEDLENLRAEVETLKERISHCCPK